MNGSFAARFSGLILSVKEYADDDMKRQGRGDGTMTTVYDTDKEGNIIVVFDSRWRFPELLGYSPNDPQYRALQRMWEKATGKRISAEVKDAKTGQG
jgi:hypothetical protein